MVQEEEADEEDSEGWATLIKMSGINRKRSHQEGMEEMDEKEHEVPMESMGAKASLVSSKS